MSNSLSEDEKRSLHENYSLLLSHIHEGEYGDYIHLSMRDYFRLIFERRGLVRLQERGREHYYDGHYNAIIRKISRGDGAVPGFWVLTNRLEGIEKYERCRFAIVSPVSYIGKTRNLYSHKSGKKDSGGGNARYLFAFAVDLDKVSPQTVKNLHYQIDHGLYPEPTFIVTSGSGLHLYFCLERPVKITPSNRMLLNRIKNTLTRCLWIYRITSNQQAVEIHDINQGYRFVGTQTKAGDIVHGFCRNKENPVYHTPSSLNAYILKWYKNRPELFGEDRPLQDISAEYLASPKPLTVKERRALEKDVRLPSHWSLQTARERFGEDWYQTVLEKGSVDWKKYSKSLYEYWLGRLTYGSLPGGDVRVGHRYWCLWFLAAWAWNCRIPYARLERDARSLMERMNTILTDDDKEAPFTVRDCNAALSIYREKRASGEDWKPIRLSRLKMVRITGISVAATKRNYRCQENHVFLMNEAYRRLHDPSCGGDGDELRGRQPKRDIVFAWRREHPESDNKSECQRDTGLARMTIRKWWNAYSGDGWDF